MDPIQLMTATEAARRLGCVGNTLKRRIAREGVIPDAILVEGPDQHPSPLFVQPRLAELSRLMNVPNPLQKHEH